MDVAASAPDANINFGEGGYGRCLSGFSVSRMEERRVGLLVEMRARVIGLVQTAEALKQDIQAELDHVFSKDGEGPRSPQAASHETAQGSQFQLPAPLPLRSQVKATSAGQQTDLSQEQSVAMLDAILKNQEALRMVLKNQDTLRNLVDQLQNTMVAMEERIQNIEKEIGVVAQFARELNQLGDDVSSCL